MGEAKRRSAAGLVKPGRAGPRGHEYWCENRCGRIVWRKGPNQIFIKRTGDPMWGLCTQCKLRTLEAVAAMRAKVEGEAVKQHQERQRCAASFRHPPHDECDGNPDGPPDPVFGNFIDKQVTP